MASGSPLPVCETLLLKREGWRLDVTLNRPELRNALSARMWSELEAVFTAIADDRSLRAVVLRGAGGTFSAGGDLKERDTIQHAEDGDPLVARNRRAGRILTLIDQAPQAVIAVVEGFALGGGMGLVCVADIAIAREDATFRIPEATLGIPIAQIVPFLVRRLGPSETRRLALTAASLSGAEAAGVGLVHQCCADGAALEAALTAVLRRIDRCAPGAMAASKRLIAEAQVTRHEALLDLAAETFAAAYRGAEGTEGAAAFREKRAPSWSSKR